HDRRVDEAGGAVPVGDVVAVGDGGTAGALDLVDDGLRGARVASGAVAVDPEVVDDDLRALAGELERMGSTEAASRAGDDGDSPLTDSHAAGTVTACGWGSRCSRPTRPCRSRPWRGRAGPGGC